MGNDFDRLLSLVIIDLQNKKEDAVNLHPPSYFAIQFG